MADGFVSGSLHSESFGLPVEVKWRSLLSGQSQEVGTEEAGLSAVAFARAGRLLVTTTVSSHLRIYQRH